MKKTKCNIIIGMFIFATLLCMLNSCSLEKRVIVTTRGHGATYLNGHNFPKFELPDLVSVPRDTVLNYKIR